LFQVEGRTGRHCNRSSRGLNSKPYNKACLKDTLLKECEGGSYSHHLYQMDLRVQPMRTRMEGGLIQETSILLVS